MEPWENEMDGHISIMTSTSECYCIHDEHKTRYTLEKYVTRSMLGQLYLGTSCANGETVLIKSCGQVAKGLRYGVEDPRREAMIMKKLSQCKNASTFMPLYKGSCDDPKLGFCIIMEYLNGSDLYDEINVYQKSKPGRPTEYWSESIIRAWFLRMLECVHWIHQHGYAHMDVSPENFRFHEGHLKIIDFGACVPLDAKITNNQVGKSYFMSPELYHTASTSQAALSDAFSLGACLFAMMSGRNAFHDRGYVDGTVNPSRWPARYRYVCTGRADDMIRFAEPNVRMSKEALDVLNRMLLADMKQRMTVEQALQHAWFNKELLMLPTYFGQVVVS